MAYEFFLFTFKFIYGIMILTKMDGMAQFMLTAHRKLTHDN